MAGELIADTGAATVTVSGPVDVSDRAGRLVGVISAAALPLPAGAATEATLAAKLAGGLPSVLATDRLKVDGSGVTQPVSLAAAVDVSDRAGRLVGVVSGAVDVTDRAGRLVGVVDTELPAAAAISDTLANPTTPQVAAALLGWQASAAVMQRIRSDPGQVAGAPGAMVVRNRAAGVWVPFDTAAATGATLTLAAPGAGLFHFITHIRFARVATAALAGTGLLTVTTTNLSGPPQWRMGNAMAAGGMQIDVDEEFTTPIRSNAANTATTFVFPSAGAAVSWSCYVIYYVGAEAF